MPELRTEITEIVTGLGMTGIPDLDRALDLRPAQLENVLPIHWDRLHTARHAGTHTREFEAAWSNGRAFLTSTDGLRHRPPRRIEWKGPHHAPGFDHIPADLRVDHVFLVSCKHQSRILHNSSPSNLFDRRLADRSAGADLASWYQACAPEEFDHFYQAVRWEIGQGSLPSQAVGLTSGQLRRIRDRCGGSWPDSLIENWQEFSHAVAVASAERWRATVMTGARREEMVWRLIRLSAAPYFILGESDNGSLRLRVATPWDWRQSFALSAFSIEAAEAGQPRVNWRAVVTHLGDGSISLIDGHVEVRWAHGRFSSVEAKIYLDTPHHQVAGYFPLASG